MNTGFDFHVPYDLLEEYALRRVPARNRAPLEEHLLICPACQNSLAKIDEYILVMKTAMAALPPLSSKRSCPARHTASSRFQHNAPPPHIFSIILVRQIQEGCNEESGLPAS